MIERPTRRSRIVAIAAAIGLVAAGVPAVLGQSGESASCLAYPPDGDSVVFCGGTRSGAIELFEQDADGNLRQLTYLGGTISSVDVSPNGATIAFDASLASAPEPQVFLIARHGPRARQIIVGGTIIELGTRQVMVGGDVVEIRGSRPHQLTAVGANTNPRFAPDGERIGFTSDRGGSLQAWSMSIDGSDPRELLLAGLR